MRCKTALLLPFLALALGAAAPATMAQGARLDLLPEEPLDQLLQRASETFEVPIVVDPAMPATRIRAPLGGTEIDYGELVSLLCTYDVQLVEEWGSGPRLVHAMMMRNVPLAFGSRPAGVVPLERLDAIPATAYISVTLPVAHADPNAVFAAIRGCMSRDQRRLGNVLYLAGSNSVIVSDLASNVRFYRDLVREIEEPLRRSARFSAELVVFQTDEPAAGVSAEERLATLRRGGEPLIRLAGSAAVDASGQISTQSTSEASVSLAWRPAAAASGANTRVLQLSISVTAIAGGGGVLAVECEAPVGTDRVYSFSGATGEGDDHMEAFVVIRFLEG